MREIRTRFAPSPTGFLHIGGLRTALYSYAFAKNKKGKFVLRIEDTDQSRYVPGATEKVYQVLKLFGLNWDEGPLIGGPHSPYVQSERVKTGLYQQYAEKLIKEDHAYYCFCSPQTKEEIKKSHQKKEINLRDKCRNLTQKQAEEKIRSGEKAAIRLRVPEQETIRVFDFIRGQEISWFTKDIDEVMLLKTDGFPTYHLGVVVDDSLMEISTILRGQEWLPSTPVHYLLYEYLGFKLPEIGHFSLILDPAGGKLSKRKGAVSCEEFLAEGYLPEAILNFIMLLGWAPKDNREIFSLTDFVSEFGNGSLQTANSIFNRQKLDWFNGVYLRKKTDQELAILVKPFLKTEIEDSLIEKIIPLIKDRMVKLADFETLAVPLIVCPTEYDEDCRLLIKKEHLEKAGEVLTNISDWKLENINQKLANLIKEEDWKTGDFYMSLRIAICGCKVTPPINESLAILGKEETLVRIKKALSSI